MGVVTHLEVATERTDRQGVFLSRRELVWGCPFPCFWKTFRVLGHRAFGVSVPPSTAPALAPLGEYAGEEFLGRLEFFGIRRSPFGCQLPLKRVLEQRLAV